MLPISCTIFRLQNHHSVHFRRSRRWDHGPYSATPLYTDFVGEHYVAHAGDMNYEIRRVGDRWEWKVYRGLGVHSEGLAGSLDKAKESIVTATGRRADEWMER
jgi:hypothetical protein